MSVEMVIKDLINERREKQRMYKHAVERYWEIKTRVVAPEKEAARKRILHRYVLDKKLLNEQINTLGDEIWKLQRDLVAGKTEAEV